MIEYIAFVMGIVCMICAEFIKAFSDKRNAGKTLDCFGFSIFTLSIIMMVLTAMQ